MLDRPFRGDWGDLVAHDRPANDAALVEEERVLSAYTIRTGLTVWIITEADRPYTTFLLRMNADRLTRGGGAAAGRGPPRPAALRERALPRYSYFAPNYQSST